LEKTSWGASAARHQARRAAAAAAVRASIADYDTQTRALAVGAGAVLVVALMIVPAATALLVTHSQGAMLAVTLLVALISSQVGFWAAYKFNTATSPTMAFVDGLIFLAVWVVVRLRSRT